MDPSDDDSRDRVSSSRMPLPEGTIPVAVALLIAGLASYAFFRVGTWALGGDEEFAPVSALWFATFALAPGIFLPLEQELSRALSARRALNQGGRPVVRRVADLGVILGGIVLVLILIASPLIATHYFEGDWWMVGALIVSVLAYAPAHLSRGIASGNDRFHAYAVVLGADGVMRIVLCVILALIGVAAAGPYGFAVAISPLFGVAYVAARGRLHTEPGPQADWQEVTPNLGWLLLGSIFAAGLVNAGPVALNLLRADDQEELVTQFSYGVLLARVPLFMFQAVQAALLPRLSRLAARNEIAEFKAGFRRLMVLVLIVGAAGTIGAFLVGPPVINAVYGAELGRTTLALLALASAGYMVALALAQAVIALKGHPLVALGWGTGMAAFLVVTWLGSDDLFRRVELGLVASSAAAIIVFAVALRHRLRTGAQSDQQSLMEAITDMPFET